MSFLNKIKEQYKGVYNSLNLYYENYGKIIAFISSPYLHLAVIISLISYPIWDLGSSNWYDLILSVLPNVLGFTLGGYAILLAFGNDNFRQLISGKGENNEPSPFMKLNGAFVHFIFIQTFSILLSLIGKAWEIKTGFFALIGFTFLIYSLTMAIAAAFAILNMSEWSDIFNKTNSSIKTKKCPCCAEIIKLEAAKCPYCQNNFNPENNELDI